MQIYLSQNAINDFYLSQVETTSGYDFYLLKLTSVVTKEAYICIPTILIENDRFIKMQIELDNSAESAPLAGILSIYLPGTYDLEVFRTTEEDDIESTDLVSIFKGYSTIVTNID